MHIKPSMNYETDAIEYIQEHIDVGSPINGSGGLHRYLNDYQGWLEKLEQDKKRIPNSNMVPAETYYLIRQSDNRIVGMVNIRLSLNEKL